VKSVVSRSPLAGVRILDLTIVVAGPVGAGVLGDLGAEVIKIEHLIARRDVSDALPMAAGGAEDRPWNRSNWFFDLNRSKKGITLNLAVQQARQAFLELVALSDVVMENFSPRVMPNLGLEYDVLRQANRDIIVVSMPGFGSTGPMRDRTAFGPGIEAMTGLADLTGYLGGPPLKPGNYVTDYNAALLAAFTIMAALHYRRRTGRGQRIEVALREGALQMIGEPMMDYAMNRRTQMRIGNRHPSTAPHGMYPCRGEDRWIAIAVGSDEEWASLRHAMGDPPWAQEERFSTAAGRLKHQDALDRHLTAWTGTQEALVLTRRLQAAGVNAAAALTTKDIAEDPHYRERGFIQEVELPEAGQAWYPRYGFQLSRTPVVTGAGPGFGEHNREVLGTCWGSGIRPLPILRRRRRQPAGLSLRPSFPGHEDLLRCRPHTAERER